MAKSIHKLVNEGAGISFEYYDNDGSAEFRINGTKVVGPQLASVAAVTSVYATGVSAATIEALATAINTLIARLETNGTIQS